MSTLQKKFVIPLERGGSKKNDNIVYWPPTILRAWELVFGNLRPYEADYFIPMISLPAVYMNILRLNKFRRLAAQLEMEDDSRDHGVIYPSKEMGKHMRLVNLESDPLIVREPIEFTKHHVIPQSRGGTNGRENIAFWLPDFHAAYHTLFGNLTTIEVRECIRLMCKTNGIAPFKQHHSNLEFIRTNAIEWAQSRKYKKPRLRFYLNGNGASDCE